MKRISLTLTKEAWEKLDKLAEKNMRSRSSMIRKIVTDYYNLDEKKKGK